LLYAADSGRPSILIRRTSDSYFTAHQCPTSDITTHQCEIGITRIVLVFCTFKGGCGEWSQTASETSWYRPLNGIGNNKKHSVATGAMTAEPEQIGHETLETYSRNNLCFKVIPHTFHTITCCRPQVPHAYQYKDLVFSRSDARAGDTAANTRSVSCRGPDCTGSHTYTTFDKLWLHLPPACLRRHYHDVGMFAAVQPHAKHRQEIVHTERTCSAAIPSPVMPWELKPPGDANTARTPNFTSWLL
jgi:hypothetical protein